MNGVNLAKKHNTEYFMLYVVEFANVKAHVAVDVKINVDADIDVDVGEVVKVYVEVVSSN